MANYSSEEVTVSSIASLVQVVEQHRGMAVEEPTLIVVGKVSRSIAVDGTVVARSGAIEGLPVYIVAPGACQILQDGSVKLHDCHPDWFAAGNDEEEVIGRDDAQLVIVISPEDLQTPPDASNVLQVPPTVETKHSLR